MPINYILRKPVQENIYLVPFIKKTLGCSRYKKAN